MSTPQTPPVCLPSKGTVQSSSGGGSHHQARPNSSMYNGQEAKRSSNSGSGGGGAHVDASSYKAPSTVTTTPPRVPPSTHNLPPIGALSSYHSNRGSRETMAKAQPSRPQSHSMSHHHHPSSKLNPSRHSEYPVTIQSPAPVNGRVSAGYPRFECNFEFFLLFKLKTKLKQCNNKIIAGTLARNTVIHRSPRQWPRVIRLVAAAPL